MSLKIENQMIESKENNAISTLSQLDRQSVRVYMAKFNKMELDKKDKKVLAYLAFLIWFKWGIELKYM